MIYAVDSAVLRKSVTMTCQESGVPVMTTVLRTDRPSLLPSTDYVFEELAM